MVKQLLSTTAVVLALSLSAWAQEATDPAVEELPQVEAGATGEMDAGLDGDTADAAIETEMELEAESDTAGASTDMEMDTGAEFDAHTAEMMEEAEGDMDMATEPADTAAAEAEASVQPVLDAQAESELRADELLGMDVVSADGEEIGEVNDLIFNEEEKITGIVVGVGGFLGIGQKRIGVDWSQAERQTDPESQEERIVIGLTSAELDEAPEFKTKQDVQREAEAAAAAAQAGTDTGGLDAMEPAAGQ